MVQLLFARLPQFKDDAAPSTLTKRVKAHESKSFAIVLFIQLHARGITATGTKDSTGNRRRSQPRVNSSSSLKKQPSSESQTTGKTT